MEFSGVVLNGGQSSRMGVDKGSMCIMGRPLIDFSISVLREAKAKEIIVVGGESLQGEFDDVVQVGDFYPGEGPLGGVITALSVIEQDLAVILSNDLLHLDSTTILKMISAIDEGDIVLPVTNGIRQVLCGVWRRNLLPVLIEGFTNGKRSLKSALDPIDVTEVFDFNSIKFQNANTPSDVIDYIATIGGNDKKGMGV
jgi:molybdopterin-guanine dinucleotide biosynthesis protein A